MTDELTPWFPTSVKPARIGFYDVRERGVLLSWRRWWDGSIWRINSPDAMSSSINTMDGIEWRGLAKEPK
jgi:hypothetical protein